MCPERGDRGVNEPRPVLSGQFRIPIFCRSHDGSYYGHKKLVVFFSVVAWMWTTPIDSRICSQWLCCLGREWNLYVVGLSSKKWSTTGGPWDFTARPLFQLGRSTSSMWMQCDHPAPLLTSATGASLPAAMSASVWCTGVLWNHKLKKSMLLPLSCFGWVALSQLQEDKSHVRTAPFLYCWAGQLADCEEPWLEAALWERKCHMPVFFTHSSQLFLGDNALAGSCRRWEWRRLPSGSGLT